MERWIGALAKRWPLPPCAQTDEYDQHANAVDERGRVALTLDITGIGSFGVMGSPPSDHAPYAFVISGNRCRPLGRAIVLALRDRWAAGYRGYLDGRLAPTNLNVIIQDHGRRGAGGRGRHFACGACGTRRCGTTNRHNREGRTE